MLRGNDRVTRPKTLRRQNIGKLAVLILDQRDERGAVRIIFQALDRRWHVEFSALEINPPVGLLVTTAAKTRGDPAVVVAATGRALPFGQWFDGRPFVQGRAVDGHQLALARRHWIVGFQRHRNALLTGPWSRRSCDPLRASRSRA